MGCDSQMSESKLEEREVECLNRNSREHVGEGKAYQLVVTVFSSENSTRWFWLWFSHFLL